MHSTLRRTKMKGWFEFYRELCPICKKQGHCLRNEEGDTVVCTRVKSDIQFSTKNPSWVHYLGEDKRRQKLDYGEMNKTHKKHEPEILDTLYRNLVLKHLRLNDQHLAHLTSASRGLTEKIIEVKGYKSFDYRTVRELKIPKQLELGGLPGLYRDNAGEWRLHGIEGILIPYRNHYNQIIGFQIRVDHPPNDVAVDREHFPELHAVVKKQPNLVQVLSDGEIIWEGTMQLGEEKTIIHEDKKGTVKLDTGMRYFWLSSANKNEGCGAGDPTPVHVAIPSYKLADLEQKSNESDSYTLIKSNSVWVTEGACETCSSISLAA